MVDWFSLLSLPLKSGQVRELCNPDKFVEHASGFVAVKGKHTWLADPTMYIADTEWVVLIHFPVKHTNVGFLCGSVGDSLAVVMKKDTVIPSTRPLLPALLSQTVWCGIGDNFL